MTAAFAEVRKKQKRTETKTDGKETVYRRRRKQKFIGKRQCPSPHTRKGGAKNETKHKAKEKRTETDMRRKDGEKKGARSAKGISKKTKQQRKELKKGELVGDSRRKGMEMERVKNNNTATP